MGHFVGAVLSSSQIGDRSSRAPSWMAECKQGLKLNRHLLLLGAQGRNYLRALTIQRNPFLFSSDWLLPLYISTFISEPLPRPSPTLFFPPS